MNPLRALFLTISRMPPALMLLVIVGLATTATLVVTDHLNSKDAEMRAKEKAMLDQLNKKGTIVVAAKDIPEGQTISIEALMEQQVEQSKIPQDAVSTTTLAAGRVAKYGITSGQIVSQHDLAPYTTSTNFEARLKPGMRAVTFAVDANTGVAGFVSPHSHVDIISMVGAGPDTKASAVLSDIEIIAVGQVYQKQSGDNAPTQASSVTVAVSTEDSQKLIKAVAASKLYLALRNGTDHTPVATVDVTSLFPRTAIAKNELSIPAPSTRMELPMPPDMMQFQNGGLPSEQSIASVPKPPLHEIEYWSGNRRDVLSMPAR